MIRLITVKLYQIVFNSTIVNTKKTRRVGISVFGGNLNDLIAFLIPDEENFLGIIKNITTKRIYDKLLLLFFK